MIFPEYLRFFGAKITRGGAPGGHNPPRHASTPGRALGVVVPTWAPSLISSAHIVTYLQKKSPLLSLSRVLELKPADTDPFA